tara:strand:+ start:474 stop:650 length:177 start_codon:yes stop_codon:yes gene_type:complete
MLVNLTKDELKEIIELISTNVDALNQYNDDTEDVEYWNEILNKLVPILNSCTCKEDTK